MGKGHEGEAGVLGELGGLQLMLRIEVGMQESYGRRGEAVGDRPPQPLGQSLPVQGPDHLSRGVQPLVRLDHAGVQRRRLDDVQGEQLGPRLVADVERVGEPLGDHQQGPRPLSLQKGVGGDRGPHLDGAHTPGRKRLACRRSQEPPHGLDRGVLIGARG